MPSLPSARTHTPSRERLLESAKRLFATQGYEQSATSAIARQAGTSESQLMRYFGGKAGLLDALFDDAWARLNARVGKAIGGIPRAREALLAACQAVVSTLSRDEQLATLLMFEGRRVRGAHGKVRIARGVAQFTDTMRALIRKAQAERDFDPSLDADALASALVGALEAMIRDRLVGRDGGGRSFAEREIGRTLDAMVSGFAGSAPTRRATAVKRPMRRPN
jgi:AcrR family transcriptional regulator